MKNQTGQNGPTIADIVSQSGGEFDSNAQDFDILLQALNAAGLTSAVADSEADLTVFAPTDAAFVQLAQDFGFQGSDEAGAFDAIVGALTELGGGDPIPVLQDVLKYHVSTEAKTLKEIRSLEKVETLLDGATITPKGNTLIDNEPDIADPRFTSGLTNIKASNGIIQGIDRVLIPLDIPGNESIPTTEDGRTVVRGTSRKDTLSAISDRNLFLGGKASDTIFGGRKDDIAKGGRGNDIIFGNGGRDQLIGGGGRDTLIGGKQADRLSGGIGADKLFGNGGNDVLLGGRGRDQLFGTSDGHQVFDGGQGNDQIFLGGGTDTVVLRANAGKDTISGFELGKTTLGLSKGLSFEHLDFVQKDGFSLIRNNHNVIAKVIGVSAVELGAESNFSAL